MTRSLAEPAPGPGGVLLPPDPARVATLPYHAFHPFGLERRRAETLRFACAKAPAIEALAERPPAEAREYLGRFPGIGVWTAAEVARLAPSLVTWALAGEPRGTDERMLELLEPYRGQRGRVQVLLEAGGITAPRFGPRMRARAIERL